MNELTFPCSSSLPLPATSAAAPTIVIRKTAALFFGASGVLSVGSAPGPAVRSDRTAFPADKNSV